MSDKIETIAIHGESSIDWQTTAIRYIELNKQKTEAIERVRTFVNDAIDYGQYIIRAEDVLKALDGEEWN